MLVANSFSINISIYKYENIVIQIEKEQHLENITSRFETFVNHMYRVKYIFDKVYGKKYEQNVRTTDNYFEVCIDNLFNNSVIGL